MSKRHDRKMIAALDVGTSKIVAIVGEIGPDKEIEIIGIGSHKSKGLKKGVVVNIEATVQSIKGAIQDAELMTGCQINSVTAGIAGSHIRSINSSGVASITDREVSQADIDRVIEAATAMNIPSDQRVLHVLPQEFIIDGQKSIRDPISMSGVRLEALVHLITGAESAAQNIIKCVRQCGLEVDDVVLEQLASSYSVLSEDEKELGVCLVDIGGGTTDIAVFVNGAIQHTVVIPIAGDQVTNDIAIALRTRTQDAEDIKIKYGCTLRQLTYEDETIEVPGIGDREARNLSRVTLVDVIHPRYEELLMLIQAELRRSGFERLIASGLVLTGGSSKIEGLVPLAEEIFDMPVRLGVPKHARGLREVISNPIHATGVGLLMFIQECESSGKEKINLSKSGALLSRMKDWFQGNF